MASHVASEKSAPPVSTVQADGRWVEYDQFIDQQIRRTRGQVKGVEIAAALMTLASGSLVFFLVMALADHWLFAHGLGFWGRCFALAVYLAGAGYYAYGRLLPLALLRINPIYAAEAIERGKPSLKNGLINFLLLRNQREQVPSAVYQAVEQQAATSLSRVQMESAVDRSRLIHLGYALLAIVALFSIYFVFSPKNPFATVGRVMMPWAKIAAPTRVVISDIEPGDRTFFRGETVEVSAELQGLRGDEPVQVFYSTADRQAVDQPVTMFVSPKGVRHLAKLPSGDGGLQQDIDYRIEAGDAISPTYHLQAAVAPTVTVDSIEYEYPTYTNRGRRQVESAGDIQALEGTKVVIHAHANQAIRSAALELEGEKGLRKLPARIDGQKVTASFMLALDDEDHTKPQFAHYRLRPEGREKPQPVQYRIDVIPDIAPEIKFLSPAKEETTVAANARLTLELRSLDPDYALSEVRLSGEVNRQSVLDQRLLRETHAGPLLSRYVFDPAKLGLKVGDTVEYWATAKDNRTPTPNETQTARRMIRIGSPDPRGRKPSDRLAQNDSKNGGQAAENNPQDQDASDNNAQQNTDGHRQPKSGDNGSKPGSDLDKHDPQRDQANNKHSANEQNQKPDTERNPGDEQQPDAAHDKQPAGSKPKQDQDKKPKSGDKQSPPGENGQGDQGNAGQQKQDGGEQKNSDPGKSGDQSSAQQGGGSSGNDKSGSPQKGKSQGNAGGDSSNDKGDSSEQGDAGSQTKSDQTQDGGNSGQSSRGKTNSERNAGKAGDKSQSDKSHKDGNQSGATKNSADDKSQQPLGDQQKSDDEASGKNQGNSAPQGQAGDKSNSQQPPAGGAPPHSNKSPANDGSDDAELVKRIAQSRQKNSNGNQADKSVEPGTKQDSGAKSDGAKDSAQKRDQQDPNSPTSGDQHQPGGQQKTGDQQPTGDNQSSGNNHQPDNKSGEQSKSGSPQNGEHPADDQPGANRGNPAGAKPGDKTTGDKPTDNNPGVDEPGQKPKEKSGEKSGDKSAGQPGDKSADKPVNDKPVGDKTDTDKANGENPIDKKTGDQQSTDSPGDDQGKNKQGPGQQGADKPGADKQASGAEQGAGDKQADKQGEKPAGKPEAGQQKSGDQPNGAPQSSSQPKQGQNSAQNSSQAGEKSSGSGQKPSGDSPHDSQSSDQNSKSGKGADRSQEPKKETEQDDQNKNATGQGDQAKSGSQPTDKKLQNDSPKEDHPDAKGGDPDGLKGNSGAGQSSSTDDKGSASTQEGNRPRENKQENGGSQGPKQSEAKSDEAKSPSNSPHESNSKGGEGGDKSGGGKAGPGQSSDQAGTGGAGHNTASQEGSSQAPGAGKGETSDKAGADKTSDHATGQSGNKAGNGSQTRAPKPGEPNANPAAPKSADSAGSPASKSPNGTPSPNGKDPGNSSGATSIPQGGDRVGAIPETAEYTGHKTGDAGNAEFAKKQFDLALDYLKKGNPDLLKDMHWSADDAQRLAARLEQMKKNAQVPGEKGDEARREMEDLLRTLGQRNGLLSRHSDQPVDTQRGLRESHDSGPPAEYIEQFDAFQQGALRGGK